MANILIEWDNDKAEELMDALYSAAAMLDNSYHTGDDAKAELIRQLAGQL